MADASLVGRRYGPFAGPIEAVQVDRFRAATGGDPSSGEVPPMFAAVYCLGPVLQALFDDEAAALPHAGVIHTEQSFTWEQPVRVGDVVVAEGRVSAVAERRGLVFVDIDLTATDQAGKRVCSGRTVLLQRERT